MANQQRGCSACIQVLKAQWALQAASTTEELIRPELCPYYAMCPNSRICSMSENPYEAPQTSVRSNDTQRPQPAEPELWKNRQRNCCLSSWLSQHYFCLEQRPSRFLRESCGWITRSTGRTTVSDASRMSRTTYANPHETQSGDQSAHSKIVAPSPLHPLE